ncbi:MAG: extracellular solute-binding protein [Actinobacteria bacterium]|nr:extracellular solute-binding protein [Actinomycetota bacterium]
MSAQDNRTTRRELLKKAGTGAIVVAYGGMGAKTAVAGVPKYRGRQLKEQLRILQWVHFVPAYDKWFDGTYTKEWGERNDTEVIIDHVNNAELPARAAAQVAAQSGHDLFQFLAPPASHEDNVIALNDVVQEVTRKVGKMGPVGYKSSFNPRTKKYFGFPDNYVPDPAHYRRDLWANVGRAPNSWEDVRIAAPKLKAAGHPVGLGMSQELDSNMLGIALLMCYGGLIQNEDHRVALNSKGTIEALKVMRDIYKNGMTPEVFAWTAASNNQAYNAGRLSFAQNAISIARALEGPPWVTTPANKQLSDATFIAPIPRGPARRLGLEHVMGVYVIWKFAKNKKGAKKFLVDAQSNYTPHFRESGFYNFPAFPGGVKGGLKAIRKITASDKAKPAGKYTVLATIAEKYTANVGWPGFSNAGVDEVFNKFLIPQMFAAVAQDKMTPDEAARTFDRQVREIFQKWRDLKKI